ncbi:hypothetical protein C8R46DRAFT_1186442 [Mycena filopes]|nr:hypothetical protein C8R46DRAFT_1344197 [Mycena filopes]KAJ7183333.1 hypothetical protein C8R46DRAFT_1186442 [Mycena filopes]
MTFTLSLDLPLRDQLFTCALEDFFDVESAPYPPATMELLSKMSNAEMNRQLQLGSPEWRRIVLKILDRNAGTLSQSTQTEYCKYLVDHNIFLFRVANALGISKKIGGRTGRDIMAIALNALIPNRFQTTEAEDWLTRLLAPAVQMVTAYNAPRLAALPSTVGSFQIAPRTEDALKIMAKKAEAAAKACSISCNFALTYPPPQEQQEGLSTSTTSTGIDPTPAALPPSSTGPTQVAGPSNAIAATTSTRPIAGRRSLLRRMDRPPALSSLDDGRTAAPTVKGPSLLQRMGMENGAAGSK